MACARQTLPLKGGSVWHFFTFFFLLAKENCHKRKTLLSPELKRRCAAAEGTMTVRCRLLSRENYVTPTPSINIRLCRGKMGKEVLSTSQFKARVTKQWLVVSTSEMEGWDPHVPDPLCAWMGMGWDVVVHPRLVGLVLGPQKTSVESGQYAYVPWGVETVGNPSKYQSKQI